MTKRTGPTNPYLRQLIEELKQKSRENDAAIWKVVAEKLENSTRRKIEVNLSQIDRHTAKDEIVVVPGIVLGSGELSKTVDVAAWRFSAAAKEKIKKAKGNALRIEELVKSRPKGTGVKILV
jgi:large subunit ribosomal protein L18e